ncbi:MAG: YdcH family protein [Candidatus Rokuibacteriota bacterium]
MPDTEAFIERLTTENHDFRKLREEHQRYEQELGDLNGRGFLSPDQQWRVSELKKLKLIAKDRMEALLRHARAATHA